MENKFNNLLLVSGTGRNTGKTTLAIQLIKQFSKTNNINALKISPHFHELSAKQEILVDNERFKVCKETVSENKKDSQRMLNAGAAQAYYIQVKDCNLYEAFITWYNLIPNNELIICESPALRRFVEPGIFIIADNAEITDKKSEVVQWFSKADFVIDFNKDSLKDIQGKIYIENNSWKCMD